MTPEFIRSVILAIGWPGLVIGSAWTLSEAYDFYRAIKRSVYGKLVLLTVTGWLLTMYGLGVVSTSYLYVDVQSAVWIVTPVFVAWGVCMIIVAAVVRRWNRDAVSLNDLYLHLEDLVRERTAALEGERTRSLNLNLLLEERTRKQAAEIEEKINELARGRREQEAREKELQEMKRKLDAIVEQMAEEEKALKGGKNGRNGKAH